MKHWRRRNGATLVELLIGTGLIGIVSAGLATFVWVSVRLVSRNLATNHSHESARASVQQLLENLHESATGFRLIDIAGSNFSDVAATASSDRDSLSNMYLSNRTAGVRFRQVAGPPFKLSASATPVSTTLQFDFANSKYVPQVGDKLVFPLIARECNIIAVPVLPFGARRTGSVTIDSPLGYTLTTGPTNITVGYFYPRMVLAVVGSELRLYRQVTGNALANPVVVAREITSPRPFGLLFPTSVSASSDGLQLRVSLESYDQKLTSRRFLAGTTTLQMVVPPRLLPTPVTATN